MHGTPSGLGIPLQDILARGGGKGLEVLLSGGSDEVFNELKTSGGDKIQFRVVVSIIAMLSSSGAYSLPQWPGYEHMEMLRTISLNTPMGWMTRGQLLFQVAKIVMSFLEVNLNSIPRSNPLLIEGILSLES